MSFPYTTKSTSIGVYLEHIHNAGIPSKVTLKYLESVGLTSKNDRPLVPLFRALGFLDSSGVPTSRYRDYRDKDKDRKSVV